MQVHHMYNNIKYSYFHSESDMLTDHNNLEQHINSYGGQDMHRQAQCNKNNSRGEGEM